MFVNNVPLILCKKILYKPQHIILTLQFSKESKYQQTKNQWITLGISKSSEKLKFLSRYIKERTVSTELINYYQIINLVDKYQNQSIKKIWDLIKINRVSQKGDINL